MSDIIILKEMFKESVLLPIEQSNGRWVCRLTEPNESDSQVIISGLPENSIVIKVDDSFASPSKLFKGEKGECKRADFIIIADSQRYKKILYIELKKTNEHRNHVINQLKGAVCFLDYCKSISNQFWAKPDLLNMYEEHFVGFANTSISKNGSRKVSGSDTNSTPENFTKITSPWKLEQFRKLVNIR